MQWNRPSSSLSLILSPESRVPLSPRYKIQSTLQGIVIYLGLVQGSALYSALETNLGGRYGVDIGKSSPSSETYGPCAELTGSQALQTRHDLPD